MDLVEELEYACADAWPAMVTETLGDWRLRAAAGFVNHRANSVLAVGDPGRPVGDALDRATAFARRHGITPAAHTVIGSAIEREIAGAGWVRQTGEFPGDEAAVLVAATQAAGPGRVVVHDTPPAGWWRLTVGRDTPNEAERHVLSSANNLGFAELVLDGTTAAVGRGAVVGDLVYLSKIGVDPAHRRRGLGTEILLALGDWGAARGAQRCVLQVATGNAAALSLYDRLGYAEHHRYRYWQPSS